MNEFPLIRARWSNEHIMTAVFAVCLLWLLPRWAADPVSLLASAVVLVCGLATDVLIHYLRFKRPICAVSAAVTAVVLDILSPGTPIWLKVCGVAVALIAGKHLWGGAGKNGLNPAVTGVLFIMLFAPADTAVSAPGFLLLPAALLSLLFIRLRPAASLGMMAGMLSALALTHDFTLTAIAATGVVFWGCLVVTDPVTVSSNPILSGIGAFLAGLLPLLLRAPAFGLPLALLLLNLVSFAADRLLIGDAGLIRRRLRIKPPIPFRYDNTTYIDLTDIPAASDAQEQAGLQSHSIQYRFLLPHEFMEKLENSNLFGMGGAGYPTLLKIRTLMESDADERFLIINGAECDPGLIHDKWIMRAYPNEIFQGVRLLREHLKISRKAILAVHDVKDLSFPTGLRIRKVTDRYPAGAEKLLIREVLGIRLYPEEIPSQKGILVLNVQTVYALCRAILCDEPAAARFLTVADLTEGSNAVVKVSLGDSIRETIRDLYPDSVSPEAYRGGGLMQARIASETDVVDKNTNFIAYADYPKYKESLFCSRCGRCASSCPVHLKVYRIVEISSSKRKLRTARDLAQKCIRCGACSYICPAGRNLAERIRGIAQTVIEEPAEPNG